MPLGTVELQVKSSAFIASRLVSFIHKPFCPPPAKDGFQVQRIVVDGAQMRNNKPADFPVWYVDTRVPPYDDGLVPTNEAAGFQAQLALNVALHFTTSALVEASPNQMVAPIDALRPVVVLDLDCYPLDGVMMLRTPIAAIEWPEGSIPAVVSAVVDAAVVKAEVAQQIGSIFPAKAEALDLEGALPIGSRFINAGMALDRTASRLAIRGEIAGGNSYNYLRWTAFMSGDFQDFLGVHDWSMIVRAADLKLMLSIAVQNALAKTLPDSVQLISVDCDYTPLGDKAAFTITANANIEVAGVTLFRKLPIVLTLSVSAQGRLVMDLRLHGVQEVLDDLGVLVIAVSAFMPPILNVIVFVMGLDEIDAAEQELADFKAEGLFPGVDFVKDPADPLSMRGELSVPVPKIVTGRVNGLVAQPEGFSIAGSWSPLHFAASTLQIGTAEFGWIAPRVSCSSVSRSVLDEMRNNPKQLASLYAEIDLDCTGTAPIKVCHAAILNVPIVQLERFDGSLYDAPAATVKVLHAKVPTAVAVSAMARLADMIPPPALIVEVRTTKGVFRAVIPPPQPLTPADINLMVSTLKVQLAACERVLPEWFSKKGAFQLDWIVNPLIDPREERDVLEITRLEISGMTTGERVELVAAQGKRIGSALAASGGAIAISAMQLRSTAPTVVLRGGSRARATRASARASRKDTPDVVVTRQRLTPTARLLLATPALAIAPAPLFGPNHFLVLMDGRCLRVEASAADRPSTEDQWSFPGALGVRVLADRVIAYGEAGLAELLAGGRVREVHTGRREPVYDVATDGKRVCLALPDRVEVCNRHLAARLRIGSPGRAALALLGGRLVIATARGTQLYRFDGDDKLTRAKGIQGLAFKRFVTPSIDVGLLGEEQDGTWSALRLERDTLRRTASWDGAPWQVGTAVAGNVFASIRSAGAIAFYHMSEPELATPTTKQKADLA